MATWVENIAGKRVSDQAELLVHHYTQALDLARAAGDDAAARELTEPVRRFLILAGDRAFDLDTARAEAYYSRALELFPPGHRERGSVLVKLGRVALSIGRSDDAERHLEEAIAEGHTNEDKVTEARAMIVLSAVVWRRGNTERSHALTLKAVRVLEHGAGVGLASVLTAFDRRHPGWSSGRGPSVGR